MRTPPDVISELRRALADYDQGEEAFRQAVELERIDDERRRSSRRRTIANPSATPGRADRLARELERRLPDLAELARAAVRASGHPGNPRLAISEIARALDGHDVHQLVVLVAEGWRDPWADGRHGPPSPYDPRRPRAVADRPRGGVARRPTGRVGRA